MLDKGLAFLEKDKPDKYGATFGGHCLLGLVAFKHTHNKNHPLVQKGLEEALSQCAKGPDNVGKDHEKRMYDISVALMLLSELDHNQYRPQIETIIQALIRSQKSHGGFSYEENVRIYEAIRRFLRRHVLGGSPSD